MSGYFIKVIPTCCSTICSYVDFIACPWLCNCELVILRVGGLPVVPQVHSQLIMAWRCDFMEVGETYNPSLICVSQEGSEWGKESKYGSRMSELTQPELIVHVTKASRVVLPVPEEFQLSILASEENLKSTDSHECQNSFTTIIRS